jgi:hypothetical protein
MSLKYSFFILKTIINENTYDNINLSDKEHEKEILKTYQKIDKRR